MILEIEYNLNPCFVDKETEAWKEFIQNKCIYEAEESG